MKKENKFKSFIAILGMSTILSLLGGAEKTIILLAKPYPLLILKELKSRMMKMVYMAQFLTQI